MTHAALEHARAQGWKVVPACAYAVSYMKRHPEFDDLR
jgi:predicted GNAT family acetyltransferase